MSTLTVVVLLFGYHTSTSSKAAGGETAFVSPVQAGSTGSTIGGSVSQPTSSGGTALTEPSSTPSSSPAADTVGTRTRTSTAPATSGATSTAPTTPTTPTTSTTPTPTSKSTGTSTVTGSVADTRWGPVQVELTVQNGTITGVSVIQYPNGNGRDQEINANALPILVQETISAQSAKIDMVSGATVTSDGYLSSLQSALDRAGL